MSTQVKHPEPTLYVRGIPRQVKDQFKALCASRGITMHAGIIELMRQAVYDAANPKRRPRVDRTQSEALRGTH